MNKLFLGIIATLLFGLGVNAQDVKEVSIKATFEIGRNSRDCKGFGICTEKSVKVTITVKLEPRMATSNPKVQAGFVRTGLSSREFNTFVNYDGRNLNFWIDKQNYVIIEKEMGGSNFVIEEDFSYSDTTNKFSYKIKAGTYPIKFDAERNLYLLIF